MDLERCVFHARTSQNSTSDELRPLSALKHSDPRAFALAIAKYDDTPERRRLRNTWIPFLEARWTEAVFFSPVRPHAIWRAWRDIAGVELPSQEFWAIPVEAVGHPVRLDRHLSRTGDPIEADEVESLDPRTYRSAAVTTARNEEWIAELSAAEKRGAWFHGTPHVLTRDPVALASAAVIDWNEP
ncbi:MAG: hypothetical protein ACTHWF_01750 [Brachybacterium sp.]